MTTSKTTKTDQQAYYVRIGNFANVFVLVLALLYTVTIISATTTTEDDSVAESTANTTTNFLRVDDEWKKDGFCIHNKDVPYLSSFDTCFYVDVLFSTILGVMYLYWKNIPSMKTSSEIVPMVIMGTVGHGVAHFAMAMKFRDGSYYEESQQEQQQEIPPFYQLVVFCFLFWFPLLKASMPKMNAKIVALLSLIVTYGPIVIGGGMMKKQLGFAYVQTVISIAFHISQLRLSRTEKSQREYMTLPLSAMLPVLTSWNEALGCEAYFRSMGGHVLYDASIIISYILYYADCYRVNVYQQENKNKNGLKQKAM
jgi:hypothetical protein